MLPFKSLLNRHDDNRLSQSLQFASFAGKRHILHRSGESVRNGRAPWFHRKLYRRFPGVHCGVREITALSIEHTDVSQISRSSSVPTCRVRVSENLEGTLDGVPRSVWRWLMYCQLSCGSRIKHFLDSILLKIPDPQGSRDKHCRSHYETYNAIVFLPRAAAKSRLDS